MFIIKKIDNLLRKKINKFIIDQWGSAKIISRGKVHNINKLPGFVVLKDDSIVGIVTYCIEDKQCEIVSLDSMEENKGIGTKLIDCICEEAKNNQCDRVWLITTNDNINAIKFYQKRNFNMRALYREAVNEARLIKPEIPLKGYFDISICHEIEFEKKI